MKRCVLLLVLLLAAGCGGKARTGAGAGNAIPANNADGAGLAKAAASSPLALWQNTTVKLVLPWTAGPPAVPSRTFKVAAKIENYYRDAKQAAMPNLAHPVVALDDPRTHLVSIVLGNCDFYLSTPDGAVGFFVQGGSMMRHEPFFVRPDTTVSLDAAIAQFEAQMPYPVLDRPSSYIVVGLGSGFSGNFFGFASQPGSATLKAVEVTDGVMRVDLQSFVPAGALDKMSPIYFPGVPIVSRPGTAWVDLQNKTIVRSIDDGDEMEVSRPYGKPKSGPVSAPSEPLSIIPFAVPVDTSKGPVPPAQGP